ncbi:MAG: DUF6427 family protein [Bacteroidia bacterium]
MLIRIFKQSHPAPLFVLLPIIAILLWIPAFFTSEYINVRNSMPLMEFVTKPFIEFTWVLSLMALIFNLISALIFNYIIDKLDVLEKKSNLPALLFIVLASSFTSFLNFHPLQPAIFFLLLSLNRVLDAYQASSALSNAFDAGFFLGIAMLFYFPFFWYMPFLWTCLLIVRPFIWREYALSVIGALLPILFSVSYYYLSDNLPYLWFDKMVYSLSERNLIYPSESPMWWGVFMVGCFILFFSIGLLNKRLSNSIIRAKSTIQVFLVYALFSIFIVFVTGTQQAYIFYLFVLPIALIWSNYFIMLKKQWLAELLFSVYLVMLIINQYFS